MAFALENRPGLPDTLRFLLDSYPRELWEDDPNFSGLVAFWLERHMMFRKLADMLRGDAELAIDGRLASDVHMARLARFGGMFLQQLHGHHQIEDMHYFPRLVGLEPKLQTGFDILDKDHSDLDALLNGFEEQANGVLQNRVEAGAFHTAFARLEQMLLRHLEDEEELIVPVILRHGDSGLQ